MAIAASCLQPSRSNASYYSTSVICNYRALTTDISVLLQARCCTDVWSRLTHGAFYTALSETPSLHNLYTMTTFNTLPLFLCPSLLFHALRRPTAAHGCAVQAEHSHTYPQDAAATAVQGAQHAAQTAACTALNLL
jgi:hypothetical protein